MEQVISTEKIPIKMWLTDIEAGAMAQVKNIANFPFAFHHVAIMPDAHEGYGMPIGGVLATNRVIIPNAVGVDIGCGVCSQATTLKEVDRATLKSIMSDIRKIIPLGFNKHTKTQDQKLMPQLEIKDSCIAKEWTNALKSLGSLGGGNHFIKIQKDSNGQIWLMLHSGSRNLGKKVADYYNRLAKRACQEKGYSDLVKQDLSFLELESELGQKYFAEMAFCVDYALANRKLIMERLKQVLANHFNNFKCGEFINIAHNYASVETHFGAKVIVHRKGATAARAGQIGIVPGSQGTESYIVRGLGNPESFLSCSHGAGRKLGRNQAIRLLNLEEEIAKLDKQGIVHAIRTTRDLDEASGAYKDISEVMRLQADLVEITTELQPLAVIKG